MASMARHYDAFGDSYFRAADDESFRDCLAAAHAATPHPYAAFEAKQLSSTANAAFATAAALTSCSNCQDAKAATVAKGAAAAAAPAVKCRAAPYQYHSVLVACDDDDSFQTLQAPTNMFINKAAYFFPVAEPILSVVSSAFELYYGTLVDTLTEYEASEEDAKSGAVSSPPFVTHIVLEHDEARPKTTRTRLLGLRARINELRQKYPKMLSVHYVRHDWILDSVKAGRALDERKYSLRSSIGEAPALASALASSSSTATTTTKKKTTTTKKKAKTRSFSEAKMMDDDDDDDDDDEGNAEVVKKKCCLYK
jgi:hypothetical protein